MYAVIPGVPPDVQSVFSFELLFAVYELEKQSELERIALQRMRVLELQSKRSTLDSILDNRTIALDAIQDERQQRYRFRSKHSHVDILF
jgi:hypothetical protein